MSTRISELREALAKLKEDYALMIQKGVSKQDTAEQIDVLTIFRKLFSSLQTFAIHQAIHGFPKAAGRGNRRQDRYPDPIEHRPDANSGNRRNGLIAENRSAKREMEQEIKSQQALLGSIRKDETKYASAIRDKQRQAKEIDRQIEKLIREAIAAENAASGKDDSDPSKFLLTPEAAIVANSFTANKGRLIWPVEKGFKSQGYGVYADAIYPGIKHESNGVIITTDAGAKARAIF